MTGFTVMVYVFGVAAAMLALSLRVGLIEVPRLRRCGACGRLRRRGVCPCSERNE